MTDTTKTKTNLAAAILFTILALVQCDSFSVTVRLYGSFNVFSFISILQLAAFIFLAVALFWNRRDGVGKVLLFSGFGILAFLALYSFLHGFSIHAYSIYKSGYSYYGSYISGSRFNLFCMIPSLIQVAGCLGMLAVAVIRLSPYLPKFRQQAKEYWFLPGVLIAISLALDLVLMVLVALFTGGWTYSAAALNGWTFFNCIMTTAAFLLSASWIVYPNGHGQRSSFASPGTGETDGPARTAEDIPPGGVGYVDMVKCVLLLIFTFGIYWFIWIYRTTDYLNRVEDEAPRDPTTKLLLCIFVPFYSIYWIYQSARRLDKLANSRGIPSDLTLICLILAIFVPIIAPMLMQDKINRIAEMESGAANRNGDFRQSSRTGAYSNQTISFEKTDPSGGASHAGGASSGSTPHAGGAFSSGGTSHAGGKSKSEIAADLRIYKELLDEGIITQEEFNKKKQELLDL